MEVLGILPFESRSHHAIGQAIMLGLAEFFHNVTVVTPYPVKRPLHYYEEISLESQLHEAEIPPVEIPGVLNIEQIPILSSLRFLYESGEDTVNFVLTHPNMIKLVESAKTFDACIIENSHFEALMVSKV
jgi:glucuronosyltransferase